MKKSRVLQNKTTKTPEPKGSFLKVNKELLSRFGPDVAIFISNLIDKYEYFKENFPDNDGWFFLVHSQQIEQTGLTIWKLYNCKRTAILNGWIETKLKGSPAKEWYKISLQLLDNQSAIGNPNSSTSCKSVSNGESLQQAIRNPNNKLLGILRTYKETMNKGDYEEGEEARSSSEELSLSLLLPENQIQREKRIFQIQNQIQEKKREEKNSLRSMGEIVFHPR
jgi:hypothetical protein